MEIEDTTKNSKLLINDTPYNVEDVNFVKPGKGRAVYRLHLRNLFTGKVLDITYHSGDKVEQANISVHEMQYLYHESENYIFMDSETFEQYFITGEQLGERTSFLKEGLLVSVRMLENTPIDVTLPNTVELKITESSPTTKTDTVTAQSVTAVLETGYSILVPAFIKEGDTIKVDTRSGSYLERTSTGD